MSHCLRGNGAQSVLRSLLRIGGLWRSCTECNWQRSPKAAVAPGIASGEIIACLAITEHAPMWSDEDIRTTATSNTDGKYQLSGTKHYVIDAQVAEVIFVAARELTAASPYSPTDTGAHGLTSRQCRAWTPHASSIPLR